MAEADGTPRKRPSKEEVLFIGLGDGSAREVAALRGATRVVAALDSRSDDVLTVGRTGYDLGQPDGARGYLEAIGIDEARIPPLVELLDATRVDARDELGQVIRVYHEAEQGKRRLDRVVVSGHSTGQVVWGDHNGRLDFPIMARLSLIFPEAAKQVRHLAMSACSTGAEGTMDQYRLWYPDLESIWAYDGSSPSSDGGAQQHLRIWERATRGKQGASMERAHRELGKVHMGGEVATWTAADGFHGTHPVMLWQARLLVELDEKIFNDAFSGTAEVGEPSIGPLYEYYRKLQRLVGHPELADGERTKWLERIEIVVRLRHWRNVRKRFGEHFASQLDAGYRAAGRTQPAWGTLSRSAVFDEARELSEKGGGAPEIAAAAALLAGLRDLDPEIIPLQWL